ncbi:MAG: ABC transporter ATP-binding protein [Rickettsiales bacterium]|nr:ABC transporter ATP-binding protein [Rickettsiales bacterium]
MTKSVILKVDNLTKTFKQGKINICVLEDISLSVKKGEVIALVGPSGCGKTTLLQILGLLDRPDHGQIIINNINYNDKSDSIKTKCRLENLGFIYQAYNLLSDFTAIENCMMPLLIANISRKTAKAQATEILSILGLEQRVNHYPSQLSGGEQQRVAIARSLIHKPSLVLADEPTGNLDQENAKKVINLLIETSRKMQTSLIIVTHNLEIVKNVDRILTINNAKIISKK